MQDVQVNAGEIAAILPVGPNLALQVKERESIRSDATLSNSARQFPELFLMMLTSICPVIRSTLNAAW